MIFELAMYNSLISLIESVRNIMVFTSAKSVLNSDLGALRTGAYSEIADSLQGALTVTGDHFSISQIDVTDSR